MPAERSFRLTVTATLAVSIALAGVSAVVGQGATSTLGSARIATAISAARAVDPRGADDTPAPVYFRTWEQRLQDIELDFVSSLPEAEPDGLTTGSVEVNPG